MQKERDPSEPRPPAVEPTRDLGLHRCPFCHEAVGPSSQPAGAGEHSGSWVSCASCLARHHAACWDEGKRCGACKHPTRLVPEGSVQREPVSALRVAIYVMGLAVVLVVGMTAFNAVVSVKRDLDHFEIGRPRTPEEVKADLQRAEADRWRAEKAAEEAQAKARSELELARALAKQAERDRDAARRAREEAATPQAYTLELVVRGLPAEGVIYALSPLGDNSGRRARVTGSLAGGRALVPGYSAVGQVALTLEWDKDGVHSLRYWPLEATGDRLELDFPVDGDATVRGRVAAGLKSVMAFGSLLSARCDVAADGTFVLAGLPPGKYALVGYAEGHSPHSGYGGTVVELGPKAEVTLEAPVPPAK